MCIIAAKFFPEIGWVAVKNRDRNYVPEISFDRRSQGNLEILYFEDDITGYCEGINSSGLSILSASLMVIDDEKEITSRTRHHSRDGERIRRALLNTDPRKAAEYLVRKQMTGNTVIFNRDTMILVESAYRNHDRDQFTYRARVIPKTQTVARTNHGIWLPWAGYQLTGNKNEAGSNISSRSRLAIAEYVLDRAQTPQDIIDGLCKKYTNIPELNALRTAGPSKQMRTTAQLMLVPSEQTMYVRPVQSHMTFDFFELNGGDHNTWVEVLSNRALHQEHPALERQPKLFHQTA